MNSKNINRREFLKLAGMTVAAGSMGGLLAGCVPAAPRRLRRKSSRKPWSSRRRWRRP